MTEFVGSGKKLNDKNIELLADEWEIEAAIIHAVDEVESNGSGFLRDKRPKILYEAHVFYHLTRGFYGRSNVSSPRWDKSLYGGPGAHQYDRLHEAIQLNRPMALQSASWGRYQVLGNNYKDLGYDSAESFVQEMTKGEAEQLEAFARFCEKNNLVQFLRDKNWENFVHRYNGPGQVEYYVEKFIEAYEKWKGKDETDADADTEVPRSKVIRFGSKGDDVKQLQLKLGLFPDGMFGYITMTKVKEFQTENNLISDGVVGFRTWTVIDQIGKEI